MPKLRSLPVDRTDQTSDHRASAMLDSCETEVANLGLTRSVNQDVRGFALPVVSMLDLRESTHVTMDDRRLSSVKVLEPACDIQHQTEHRFKRRTRDIALLSDQLPSSFSPRAYNIVEQVTVLAQLADEHTRDLRIVLGYANTPLSALSAGSFR